MDLYKTIKDLYQQKKHLDLVIASLEELEKTSGGAGQEPQKRRGRPKMDTEARREVSERMKRYWAKRRKETKLAASLPKAKNHPEMPPPQS